MVQPITQKGASQVQLIFPAKGLDKKTQNILSSAVSISGPIFQVPALTLSSDSIKGVTPSKEKKEKALEGVEALVVNLGVLLEYFKGFKVEQIELWISGAAETSGLLKLAIAAKGEGGVKVVLKPSE
jgi:hypothetical protein